MAQITGLSVLIISLLYYIFVDTIDKQTSFFILSFVLVGAILLQVYKSFKHK